MNKIICTVLVSLLLVGCSNAKPEQNTAFERDFKSLVAMVSDSSDSEVHISSFIEFDWDKAYLFSPYTPQEDMEQLMGSSFKDQSGLAWREDIYLMVFKYNGEVVQYAELERQHSDFSIGEGNYLTPTNDVLVVLRR